MDYGGWGERRLIGGPTDWSGKDRAEDACLHVSLWRREAASLHSIEDIRASFPLHDKGGRSKGGRVVFSPAPWFLFFSSFWCQCNHTACRRLTICPGRKRAARIPGAAGSQHGVLFTACLMSWLALLERTGRTGVVTVVGTGGWLKREKRRKKKKKIANCETFVGRE